MKSKFKILIAAALFIGMGSSAWAQSAALSTTATVYAALTITNNTGLAYGDLAPTTSGAVAVSPYSGGTHTNLLGTPTVGSFTIDGANNATVLVKWTDSFTLTGVTETNTMTCNLVVVGHATTQPSSGAELTIPGGSEVTLNATGDYKLWVGGSLGTLTTQAADSYTGSSTFTVEYN